MKFNGILTLVVTVLAVVLISSACIIPVVQSTQEKQYSTDNNTNELFVIANNSDSTPETPTVLELTAEGNLIINGVADTQAQRDSVDKIWGLNVGARVRASGGSYIFNCVYWDTATTSNTYSANKLVYDGSTITAYQGDTVRFTTDSNYFIYPYSQGTYGQFNARDSAVLGDLYINKDATVFIGVNGDNCTFMSGNYTDGFQQMGYSGSATLDTATLSYTAELSDALCWQFTTAPTVVLSDSGGIEPSTTLTSTSIYAPIEYKYISDNDSVIIAMLSIIPVLILLVPIMLVVRSFAMGRD